MSKIKYVLFSFITMFISFPVFAVENEFMTTGYYKCGHDLINHIPEYIIKIASSLYNVIMVVVPIILVIMGVIDLVKGIMSQKDDEITKARSSFLKRIIVGLIIFLVTGMVKFLVGVLDSDNSGNITECVDCFINGTSKCDVEPQKSTLDCSPDNGCQNCYDGSELSRCQDSIRKRKQYENT